MSTPAPHHLLAPTSPSLPPNWTPHPTRTTTELLTSCILTLVLSSWTTLHLNIPGPTLAASWVSRMGVRLGWMVMALLVPEYMLLVAVEQFIEAARLAGELAEVERVKGGRDAGGKQTEDGGDGHHAHDHEQSQGTPRSMMARLKAWWGTHIDPEGMEKGFYVLSGGYCIELQPFQIRTTTATTATTATITTTTTANTATTTPMATLTLTPIQTLTLARLGLLSPLSSTEINDKSKADPLAKGLACLQAVWFCVQMFVRVARGHSVPLVEVSTGIHAVVALVVYLLWLRKPQGVMTQTVVRVDRGSSGTGSGTGSSSTGSKEGEGEVGGDVSRNRRGVADLVEHVLRARCFAFPLTRGFWRERRGDGEGDEEDEEDQEEALPLAEASNNAIVQRPDGRFMIHHIEFCEGVADYYGLFPAHASAEFADQRLICRSINSNVIVNTPRIRAVCVFDGDDVNGGSRGMGMKWPRSYRLPEAVLPTLLTLLRDTLDSTTRIALPQPPPRPFHYHHHPTHFAFDNRIENSRIEGPIGPPMSNPNEIHMHTKPSSGIITSIKSPFPSFTLIQIVYASLHLIPWHAHFPTLLERYLWRASAVFIAASLPVMYILMEVILPWVPSRGNRRFGLRGEEEGGRAMWGLRGLRWLFSVVGRTGLMVGVVMYTFARLMLLVEPFVGVRSMPVGAERSGGWVEAVPHL